MARWYCSALLTALALMLAGCGGDITPAPSPENPDGPIMGDPVHVGPMLVRPASTAGFRADALTTGNLGPCSFVALHGARIDYLASQALLDRIVFSSDRGPGTEWNVWVCDLDGSNPVQVTDNTANEYRPEWSPDGTKIVLDRTWPAQDTEIIVINADGSSPYAVTNNGYLDRYATWSPDGREIAYGSLRANWDVWKATADGASEVNLTSHVDGDDSPYWSRSLSVPQILFVSDRDGNAEVYKMDEDGTGQTRLTNNTSGDLDPVFNPGASRIAYTARGWSTDVFIMTSTGTDQANFTRRSGSDERPSWSTDGRWIAFERVYSGNREVIVQQADLPRRDFRVTNNSAWDGWADLGSPTLQVERVLIGSPGTDWGGLDPIWSSAYAGVVAFDPNGYVNFVRIGVEPADASSIEVTPLDGPGFQMAGVVVAADEIANVRQDGGRSIEPTVWQFDPGTGAIVMYFNGTGRLASVLAVEDSAYPSGADAGPAAVTQRLDAGALAVDGAFAAVYDAEGNRVGADASSVRIDADGGITVLR